MLLRTLPLITALTILPGAALAGEDVPLESLPPAAKATVLREVKGGQILDLERDVERGKVIFEVEFVESGQKWEIKVAEDGTLLSRHPD